MHDITIQLDNMRNYSDAIIETNNDFVLFYPLINSRKFNSRYARHLVYLNLYHGIPLKINFTWQRNDMDANALFLLVDDDPDDLMLLKEAIHSIDKTIRFAEAMDGRSALNYLKDIVDQARLPSLVVLDINMPVLNGRELLAILKSENQLKHVPVVVLTTSSYPGDVDYCKQFNVELITKPFGMTELVEISKKLITSYS